ncbi:MAG TPA: hypothetical protein VGM01_06945 [Ktedonobacteraceae bacterium]
MGSGLEAFNARRNPLQDTVESAAPNSSIDWRGKPAILSGKNLWIARSGLSWYYWCRSS